MAKKSSRARKRLQVKAKKKKGTRPVRFDPTVRQRTERESEEQQGALPVQNTTSPPSEPSDPPSPPSLIESAALSSLPSTSPPPLPPPLADASNDVDATLQRFLEILSAFEPCVTSPVDPGLPKSDLPDCFTVQETDNDSLFCSPYSVASSRTESTDYGIYARRMALSQPGSNDPSPFFEPLESFGSFSPFTHSPECFTLSPFPVSHSPENLALSSFTHSPENFALSSFTHSPLAQLSPALNPPGDFT